MATRKFCLLTPLVVNRKISHWLIILPGLVFLSLYSFAQTNISGIVNSYYQVIDVVPAKACVRLNTVAGLAQGDKAMIVQMKGATINTSNSSAFGDTTSLNNAGNYEIGTICYLRGDSVFFVFMFLNQYTVTDKVQLVRIPEYVSATVTDTLKAAPWNNTNGTGGVLAIHVEQDLVLNAPIFADMSGYRGGAYIVSSGTCSNAGAPMGWYYNANNTSPQSGSFKGEGVFDITAAFSGGRGAPANGGGGGNNHNNGGAGGANLSSGGDGGGNSSTTGCTVTIAGRAGKALSSHGGKKIFMGGGGGAGHVNNNLVSSNGGGHGGGIIFIQAENLTGNSYKISANGQVGGPAASDGASGAGAGGTIILDVDNYIGTTTVESNGAQGGTEADGGNIGRCYGAGGGGSGGVIYFSGATPAIPVTVTGGAAGPETGRDASCAAVVPSAAGADGLIIPNYTYFSSLVLANSYCSVLLPVELSSFTARFANEQTWLNWKVPQPETINRFLIERSNNGTGWTKIAEQVAVEGTIIYQAVDLSPHPGYYLYRIKIIKKSSALVYSPVQRIYVPGKNKDITIYPNPASKKMFITGVSPGSALTLSDISGKLIWQKRAITNQGIIEVALPLLPSGVYIIKIDGVAKRLIIR
ncbi:MAG: T9SS type A sorting domain-containing protein [Bacteroidota bacterium]